MRKRSRIQSLSLCVGGLALTGFTGRALAQQAVTGNLATTPVNYGSNVPGTGALATQSINTGFGNSTYTGTPDGPDANGSELDAAYGVVQNGNLDLFFSGNFENNGNHVSVFIDDGAVSAPNTPSGQNTLNISNGWTAAGMNGSVFSPGFNADLLLDANDYQGNLYVDQYNLNTSGSTNSYLGSVGLSAGIGNGSLGGIGFGLNNSNVSTMGASGDAASQSAAQSVSTGLEISIPMSALGNPTNIKVLAAINGGGDTYASNQFLPGLPVGTANVGGGGTYAGATAGAFNFSTLDNEYFQVAVGAAPNGTWLNPVSGFSWGTAANWTNGYIPGVAGDAANFAGASTTSTVTLDGARTVGTMSFDGGANPYTIASGSGGASSALTFDNGGSAAMITNFSGSNTISAPVVLSSNTTIAVINNTDTFTVSGNVSGSGALTVDNPGDGVVLLSGVNNYAGATTVQEGFLDMGSSTAIPTGTALTLSAQDLPAGVLNLNGFNATVSSISVLTGSNTTRVGAVALITNASSVANTSTFTYAGSNDDPSTLNNANISDNSANGGGTLAVTVASGSLTLEGTDTYGGVTTVNNGATLEFSSATSAGTTFPSGGNAVNNGTMVLNDSVTVGAISGSGTTTITAGQDVVATTVAQGTVDNEGDLTIYSGGTIGKITETGTAGALAVYGGTLQLALNGGTSTQSVLYIQGGATLDITNNHLFIDYGGGPDPMSTIYGYLQSGYNNGTWNGTGIISSSAQIPTNGLKYGIGWADGGDGTGHVVGLSNGQIELRYTLLGDANLDGTVNGSDFSILAANFGLGVTNWDQGNFLYGSSVNGSDFSALAANFGQGDSGADMSITQADIQALDAFAIANGLPVPTINVVPEPASAGLLAGGVLGILARRRRGSSRDCR